MSLLKEAEKFARKSHKGQKQSTGEKYLSHPKKVAVLLKKWKQCDEVIAAGLLHDVVEDSEISLNQIKKKFGKRVAFLVDGMSWRRDKNGKKNLTEHYKRFSRYSQKDPSLVLIKLADMITNIPNIHAKKNRGFITNKSYPRSKTFWLPFLKRVGFAKEANKIEKEYNKYTKKKIKSTLLDYISKKGLNKIKEALKNGQVHQV